MAYVGFSQAKKPTIMVVPSDNWCIKNGYTMTYDDMARLKQFQIIKWQYKTKPICY